MDIFHTRATSHLHQISGVIKSQNKLSSKEPMRRITSDCRTCHVALNKTKVRVCSEDLSRGQNKVAHNCVYERLRLSGSHDNSWRATKRHAIYSDTLALPMPDLIEPRRILLASTPRTSPVTFGHCTAFCCPEDVFGTPLNTSSPRIIPSPQSEKDLPGRRFPIENRSSADFPSVPHLRLSRKFRDSLTVPENMASTLDFVYKRPLGHSRIILDLLFQLDQAIEEWDSLGRDCSQKQSRIRVTKHTRI